MKDPLHILSVGPFGRAVARYLRKLHPGTVETAVDSTPDPATWPQGRITALASWRPVFEVCELLDRSSHETGTPFVPLIADSRWLSLGPVVIPRGGPCWGCWVKRTRQHAAHLQQRLALADYYATHPEAGPGGYLDPFALLAAARIGQIVDALDAGRQNAGDVWQIDMSTLAITTSTVIGVHDCARCGLARDAESRTFREMREQLASLWQPGNAL